MPIATEFFTLEKSSIREIFNDTDPVWTVLDRLGDYLTAFFRDTWPLKGISGQIEKAIAICDNGVLTPVEVKPTGPKGKAQVFYDGKILENAAVIMAGAFIFDDRILIGPGSIVEPGALIKGPTIIGENSEIRQGAYMRGDCLVGNGCVVGHTTEMKNSIMLDGAQAGHFAYIGDSILGRDVNLGAGTKLANLKMIPGNVIVRSGRERYDTGRRKLGAILGDQTETGCNSVTSPGSLLSPGSIIYPGVAIPGGYYSTRTTFMPPAGSPRIRSAK